MSKAERDACNEPSDDEILEHLAQSPEECWRRFIPDIAKDKLDFMLVRGCSPEWILMKRQPFLEMPTNVQTCYLNGLHWRQKQLQDEGRI
jgi:hypothetical protein